MLLKLNLVQEIGRFSCLKHKAPQFSRLTLIFARNGYGKSTICAVLRSAAEAQPNYIHSRKRLNAKRECRIDTTWASTPAVTFENGKWNCSPGAVYIYDQEFVHQNLHVGDSVTRDNKRSLLPVVLGEKGVVLAQSITQLDREQRELETTMRNDAAIIQAKCPAIKTSNLLAFCTADVPLDVGQRVRNAAQALELAKQSVQVQSKKNPKTIAVKETKYYQRILSHTVEMISSDAAQLVQSHINNQKLGSHGSRWIEYGLRHMEDCLCPFCGQSTSYVIIVNAYRTYFSDLFKAAVEELDGAAEALRILAGGQVENGLSTLVRANSADLDFWTRVCDLSCIPELSQSRCSAIGHGLSLLLELVEKKLRNPMETVEIGDKFEVINDALATVAYYNECIEKCSDTIDSVRKFAENDDLMRSRSAYDKWAALEARQTEPLKSITLKYAHAEGRRKQIETEKKSAQLALVEYARTTLSSQQDDINELLSNFGANFRIVDTKANFIGREPNTDYSIEIGDRRMRVGEKSATEPSFKTVLSTGDNATLALAFFLSHIRANSKLSEAIVVFDDPFSSQDITLQFETASQIRAISSRACQTIVLSHDARFLHIIENDADRKLTGTFHMVCTESGDGSILEWSSADELRDLYLRNSQIIRAYANHGTLLRDVTWLAIQQAMRPFLESYVRSRFPGRFSDGSSLYEMANDIKQSGDEDPMFKSVDDILAINEFTRPIMHGGGEVADPTALRAQCRKIVRIIGKY